MHAGGCTVHLTVQKYLPHAKRITTIYLKGRPRKRDTDLAQFRPIASLYDELRQLGADELVARIDMLRHRILRPELQKRFHNLILRKSGDDQKTVSEIMEYASSQAV